jgi:hypothetical protein
MGENKIQANFDNFKDYKEKIGKALDGELSLFERFTESIVQDLIT